MGLRIPIFSKTGSSTNNVLSDTLKSMESNELIEKRIFKNGNKNLTEYYITPRGLRLNRILFEMASFGLDELECGDEGDLEIIKMFKEYYSEIFKIK